MITKATAWLDVSLGRVTMYRLMVFSLGLLAALAVVLGATGGVSFSAQAQLASLAVLLVVTYAANRAFAAFFRVIPHSESSIITALLLFFILQPTTDVLTLAELALAAVFASGSKYVLAVRGRHIFNPAAIGAVWLAVFHFYLALWWVGTPVLVIPTAVLALLVLYRTHRMPLAGVFVAVAAVILIVRSVSNGTAFPGALKYAFAQTPLVFFCGFMLSEPLTLPPLRWQQLSVAGLVGVLFAVPITVGSFTTGPETALVIGNLLAFFFGQRRGIDLELTSRQQLSPRTMEFAFRPARPLAFTAGQYLELAVPHRSADRRGVRRSFSIVSAPSDSGEVRIGLRMPEKSSSFKTALRELPVGTVVRATGVSGDFVLPRKSNTPLLLIAGGIGVTPFVSQLAALGDGHGRDVVVVYVAGDVDELSYLDDLAATGARVVLVTRAPVAAVPAGVRNLVVSRLTGAGLAAAVPDLATRRVYASGPPGLVDEMARAAADAGAKRLRKDYFSGY